MRLAKFDAYQSLRLRKYFSRAFGIDVGLYSYGCFDRWRMPGPMAVGRYCSIAATVRVIPAGHPLDGLTTHPALYDRSFGLVDTDGPERRRLVIEDDVWIGHNAILLPGCKMVGRGAVIGAGAIVTRDVPPYTVMAGNPARKIKDRFAPDLAAAVNESRWWLLDLPALRRLAREQPQLFFMPTIESLKAWHGAGGHDPAAQ